MYRRLFSINLKLVENRSLFDRKYPTVYIKWYHDIAISKMWYKYNANLDLNAQYGKTSDSQVIHVLSTIKTLWRNQLKCS